MKQLGVHIELAYSPKAKAKGRVERRNGQDRLVKETRLAGISMLEPLNHLEPANRFLEAQFFTGTQPALLCQASPGVRRASTGAPGISGRGLNLSWALLHNS